MANYKTFVVTSKFKVDRAVWRNAGWGDQPSKGEVYDLFHQYVLDWYLPGATTTVKYEGAPGSYKVTQVVRGTEPWWRRLGFGSSAAKREVHDQWVNRFSKYTNEISVTVEIG